MLHAYQDCLLSTHVRDALQCQLWFWGPKYGGPGGHNATALAKQLKLDNTTPNMGHSHSKSFWTQVLSTVMGSKARNCNPSALGKHACGDISA